MYTVAQLIGGVWGAGGDGGELVVRDPADGPAGEHGAGGDGRRGGQGGRRRPATRRPEWAATAPAERAAALHRAADAVEAAAEELAAATTAEMGKPLADARGGVAAGDRHPATVRGTGARCAAGGRCTATPTRWTSWPRSRAAWSPRSPRGTTRWRSPAGCSARPWSPATWCSTSRASGPRRPGWLLARALDQALPAGVLSLLTGGAGGGCGAGRRRRSTWWRTSAPPPPAGRSPPPAARTGAKVLLENGGSDPLIVDAGVDPVLGGRAGGARRVRQRRADLRGGGADLRAPGRGRGLRRRAGASGPRRCGSGPGRDPGTELGPLVDRRHRDHVHGQVAAAVADGARVRAGGEVPDGPGAFYPATVRDRLPARHAAGPGGDVRAGRPGGGGRLVRRGAAVRRRLPVRAGRHGADRRR